MSDTSSNNKLPITPGTDIALNGKPSGLSGFHPAVQKWLAAKFRRPVPVQEKGWNAIRSGRHTLIAAPDGQLLTEPEVAIDAYWTSLDWDPADIQTFYQQRGTSEQFHSELKTDLDLERLPSGKLSANQHILDLGMIAYNVLRLLGQQMLGTGQVPGRKADSDRLRLRTVLNSLIYMAGRLVYHARQHILRIFEGHGWAPVAMSLAGEP